MTNSTIKQWLTTQTSLSDLQSQCIDLDLPLQARRVVLEIAAALEAQMMPGDELWRYSTPPASWAGMCGRSGLAILRGDSVAEFREIAMN
jgi:hypothetical protein